MRILSLTLMSSLIFVTLLGCEGGIDVHGKVYEPADKSIGPYFRIVNDGDKVSDKTLKTLMPVASAKVELLMPLEFTDTLANPWREEKADKDGVFRLFSTVPPSDYKFIIRVSKDGYEPIEVELDYPVHRHAKLECVLKKRE